MQVCLAAYETRLATILENTTAYQFYTFSGDVMEFRGFSLRPPGAAPGLAAMLIACETHVLVCGAVSRIWEDCLKSHGIRVFPWICGSIPAVLESLARGDPAGLTMPGSIRNSAKKLCQATGQTGRERIAVASKTRGSAWTAVSA